VPDVPGLNKPDVDVEDAGLLFRSSINPINPPRPAPVKASNPLSVWAIVGFRIATPSPTLPALISAFGVAVVLLSIDGTSPKFSVDSAGVLTGIAMIYPVCLFCC
jgi:hypothetical protein